jgi:tetratricopeptide (TPR) repeat protein
VTVALGAALAAGAPVREAAPRLVLVPAAAFAAGVVCSLTLPWLSARQVDRALAATVRGDLSAAIGHAKDASDLNPFSIEPLQQWAFAEALRGRTKEAVHLYERAAVLQPSNAAGWYELGAYELRVGRLRRAWRDLNWAYGLDPQGDPGAPNGPLAQTRKLLFGDS